MKNGGCTASYTRINPSALIPRRMIDERRFPRTAINFRGSDGTGTNINSIDGFTREIDTCTSIFRKVIFTNGRKEGTRCRTFCVRVRCDVSL